MNDGFLMGVLHAFANLDQQLQSLPDGEVFTVAVLGDGNAGHILHYEVGLPVAGGAGVEDFGNRRMVHHGQRLPLDAKALQQLGVVDADSDELDRDLPLHGRGLLGEPDLSHAAFAEAANQLVLAESRRFLCAGAAERGSAGGTRIVQCGRGI